jgi:hypothetical protein
MAVSQDYGNRHIMRSSSLSIPGALFCTLLAACSSVQWERPGTDAASADRDLRQCEAQAKAYGRRSSGMDQPSVIVSPRGEVGVAVPPAVARSDPAAEYDALKVCMQDKGYRQRPAP